MNHRNTSLLLLILCQITIAAASETISLINPDSSSADFQNFTEKPDTQEIGYRKNIYVTGVVLNDSSKAKNGAIFYINGKQQFVTEGELIDQGIILQKVAADHVQVSYLYNAELIKLSGNQIDEKSEINPDANLDVNNTIDKNIEISLTDSNASNEVIDYQSLITISKDEVKKYFESTDAFQGATFTPFPEGGFLISNIQPDSVFTTMGFKKWDVIFSANDKAMDELQDMLWLKEQLLQGKLKKLKVREYGSINYVMREYFFQ